MNEHHSTRIIGRDHPCLAGHFPGNPIVPGVVLLECVAQAAQDWLGKDVSPRAFPNVKFLSPLMPDERMDIVLSGEAPQLRFRCECGGRLLAQGSFTL